MIELNKIYNEDCTQTIHNIPDNFVDLIVTSPPYDNLRTYANNIDENWNEEVWKPIIKGLYRIIKEGGVVVWIVGDATKNGSESCTSFKQALYFKEVGFKLFDTMIYEKKPRGACGNNKTYWQTFEYMFIFSKGTPKTINLICDRENKEERSGDNGTKRLTNGELKKVKRGGYGKYGRRTNVWRYDIGNGKSTKYKEAYNHPAIFPEQLAIDHIISWSNKNDIVYDPFMGSGTTAQCAIQLGRNFIGSEISKEYMKIIESRIKKAYWEYGNIIWNNVKNDYIQTTINTI